MRRPSTLHEEVLVKVDVEHRRVFVGLVCEEHGDRRQNGCRYEFAEQDGPLSVACHSHAGVVEDIVDDEYEHGDNHRHSQSAFADDGSQRGTDKEEDEARESQRELSDGFDLVLAVVTVEPARIVQTHLNVGELGLYV